MGDLKRELAAAGLGGRAATAEPAREEDGAAAVGAGGLSRKKAGAKNGPEGEKNAPVEAAPAAAEAETALAAATGGRTGAEAAVGAATEGKPPARVDALVGSADSGASAKGGRSADAGASADGSSPSRGKLAVGGGTTADPGDGLVSAAGPTASEKGRCASSRHPVRLSGSSNAVEDGELSPSDGGSGGGGKVNRSAAQMAAASPVGPDGSMWRNQSGQALEGSVGTGIAEESDQHPRGESVSSPSALTAVASLDEKVRGFGVRQRERESEREFLNKGCGRNVLPALGVREQRTARLMLIATSVRYRSITQSRGRTPKTGNRFPSPRCGAYPPCA